MADKSDCILIFADGESTVPSADVRRGLRDKMKNAVTKASEVTVSTLQDNMRCFLSSLNTILSSLPEDVGGLTLDEVEIQAEIDGKGNVGISGIASAELATKGGIKFVLRKKM
jgi:hypothetical protein